MKRMTYTIFTTVCGIFLHGAIYGAEVSVPAPFNPANVAHSSDTGNMTIVVAQTESGPAEQTSEEIQERAIRPLTGPLTPYDPIPRIMYQHSDYPSNPEVTHELYNLYVMNSDGTGKTEIGYGGDPALAPDGSWFAVAVNFSGVFGDAGLDIATMNLDRTGGAVRLTHGGAIASPRGHPIGLELHSNTPTPTR